jgi:hypothetical protein
MKDHDNKATASDKALFASPLESERMSTRDQVPYKRETLASRARKFLTLSAEFKPQTVGPLQKPVPTYADWFRAHCARPRGCSICSWPAERGGSFEALRRP